MNYLQADINPEPESVPPFCCRSRAEKAFKTGNSCHLAAYELGKTFAENLTFS